MGNDRQGDTKAPPCIIYFHEGFSPYLPFALKQARLSNSDARIILLGDIQNRIQGIQYEHHLLSDYEGRHQEFLDCYRHFHPGHLGDERRCIERWVYLSEFIKKHKIGSFYFWIVTCFCLAISVKYYPGAEDMMQQGPQCFGLFVFFKKRT